MKLFAMGPRRVARDVGENERGFELERLLAARATRPCQTIRARSRATLQIVPVRDSCVGDFNLKRKCSKYRNQRSGTVGGNQTATVRTNA